MSKNQIFTSPLGIGLGIGIGGALGTIVIGAIRSIILKYSKGEDGDDGKGVDEDLRSSSMFNFDPDLGRGSSLSKNPLEDLKQDNAFNKAAPNYGHTKVRGGKHSKKIKRKGKGKKKFSTLKKV